jgi:transposase
VPASSASNRLILLARRLALTLQPPPEALLTRLKQICNLKRFSVDIRHTGRKMSRPRSRSEREQALAALSSGLSQSQVCQAFGVHRSTLRLWHQRAVEGDPESLENRYHGGNPRKIKPEHEEALMQQMKAFPDATLEEHAARWEQETGQRISRATMARAILRLEPRPWTLKKRA